ncbi:19635_t:CDS:1, partial [Racocetra fulgida]
EIMRQIKEKTEKEAEIKTPDSIEREPERDWVQDVSFPPPSHSFFFSFEENLDLREALNQTNPKTRENKETIKKHAH